MSAKVLRPLNYGQLLDETFDLYKKNFKLLAGIVGVVYLPMEILSYAVFGSAAPNVMDFLMWPLMYLTAAACTWAVSRIYLGHQVTIREAYGAVWQRFWTLMGTMVSAGIRVVGGYLLLIVPGIILAFRYAFVSQVFVIEGLWFGLARQRSRQLAGGMWGRIFVLGLLVMLIQMVVLLAFYKLGVAVAGLGIPSGGHLQPGLLAALMGLVTGIGPTLALPVGMTVSVLFYYDVRVRKEGYDLELLAADMEARSQTPAVEGPAA